MLFTYNWKLDLLNHIYVGKDEKFCSSFEVQEFIVMYTVPRIAAVILSKIGLLKIFYLDLV